MLKNELTNTLNSIVQKNSGIFGNVLCLELGYNNFSNKEFEIVLRDGGGAATGIYSDKKLKECIISFLKDYSLLDYNYNLEQTLN